MRYLTVIFLCALLVNASQAQEFDPIVTVRADQPEQLVALIEDAMNGTGSNHIKIIPGTNGENQVLITDDYMDTSTAFPAISLPLKISANENDDIRIVLNPSSKKSNTNHDYNAFYVFANAILYLQYLTIEGFSSAGNGGAISAADSAFVYLFGMTFLNNVAAFEGGAIFLLGNARLFALKSRFEGNRSNGVGGAISLRGAAYMTIILSAMINNVASPFGCDFNVNSTATLYALFLMNNVFNSNCANVLIENPLGRLFLIMNTFYGNGNLIDSTASAFFFGNILRLTASGKKNIDGTQKAVCNDFGTNAIQSLGYNISTENSCAFNQATDMANTDPMINPPDANNLLVPMSGSPVIDAGASQIQVDPDGKAFLPCAYADSRGLGRPQDANGDGVFECDLGSYEVQGGDDLTNAQSGLYYDIDRSGEGIIVEMLGGESALVTMFTYHPNKTDLMWLIGVGKVVGNSIVIDNIQRTSGGVFGASFNADNIVRTDVGGMSIVFPDCNSTNNPGRLTFQAGFEFVDELENLLVKNQRLSKLLDCSNQSQPNSMTGRSGAFYDPSRSGEGVFVEVLDNGSAVVIFYSYTPDGKQFWFISSDVQITGNTITATMVYPASTTGFGSQFVANEVDLQPWGSLILEYQTGCNLVDVSYDSIVMGFGTGNLSYQRLTQPAGTTCDL